MVRKKMIRCTVQLIKIGEDTTVVVQFSIEVEFTYSALSARDLFNSSFLPRTCIRVRLLEEWRFVKRNRRRKEQSGLCMSFEWLEVLVHDDSS